LHVWWLLAEPTFAIASDGSCSQVRNVTQDVGATTRVIGEQALGAEKSVAHIERYVTTCATAQVQSARTFLQQLNIAACAQ
jgi:hypothetical protein